MRILLTMNLPYEPALGGANKANRVIAEMLAERGHSVCVVVPATSERAGNTKNEDVIDRGNNHMSSISELNGVELHAVNTATIHLRAYLARQLRTYAPDCIAVSSEDPLQLLLYEAIHYDSSRIVYFAHSPNCLPFGPSSFCKSDRGLLLMSKIAAVVAVSRFCADYILNWSDIKPVQIYLPVYGSPPFPNYGRFDEGYITLVNPCAYKGIDIFIELSQMCRERSFATVPSWGTTSADVKRLGSLPNVTLLDPHPDIDIILGQTKILLVPSLCLENFPMIIIESMLRGIPVVASNIGGISEAKLGTRYLIPISPIQSYTNKWDENKLWIPIIPVQNVIPWRDSLTELLSDIDVYTNESICSRDAAGSFIAALSLNPLEQLFKALKRNNN